VALKSNAVAEKSKDQLSRDFCGCSIFDFCNNIGQQVGGLIVTPSALTATRRDLIISLAARFGLPAIYSFGFYAASGGLMSYGINQLEQARPAASYVNQILRGANPGDLPVQLPLKYELVINLKTAAALGLTAPNSLQLLADQIIE
jgi:putative ABC transport system substrate-binding protein